MLQFGVMAPPRSNAAKPAPPPPQYRSYPPRPAAGPPEVVDPIWLLKAIAILIVAALICGYGTLCFLLYQGQWQLILHPKQTSTHPDRIADQPVEFVRFGPDESAVPQRTGWSVAAGAGARYSGVTVLLLPAGDGSLTDDQPTIAALHAIGVNVFAMDYRGYGQSAAVHPNEQRMSEDAASALQFLTASRGVQEKQLVIYGIGLGASLATRLAAEHPAIPAIVLDSPAQDPLVTVQSDPRTKMLPVGWLLRDRFTLTAPLATLPTPKLLLSPGAAGAAFTGAAAPKITVELREPRSGTVYAQSVSRFLDQYLPGGVQRFPFAPPAR